MIGNHKLKMLLMAAAMQFCAFSANPLLPTASAQCGIENKAFQSGEFLYYDLFFNWKFIWVKVGTASMSTNMSTYNNQKAYRSSLITRGNNKLDKFFVMRDTLVSYCTEDIVPLYYRKGAEEGKRYYVDELWYSYPNGNSHVKQHRLTHRGEHQWKESEFKECIYDMMSIFLRARNYDASKLKKGDNIPMPVCDARKLSNSWLKFRGRETFKMDGTGEKYKCLVFSFIEREDGKNHELIRFYVTDDQNHIPVRLDMFLSFGSAKAFLKAYRGIKSPMTSKIN